MFFFILIVTNIILKKIIFIVSEDWYFVSHRLHLATTAINNGYEVTLLSRVSKHQEFIRSLGITTINWPLERKSLNPIRELISIYHIVHKVRRVKPNLVHAVGMKPIIYTALSKLFFSVDGIVLALGGLGFIFRSSRASAKILRICIVPIFRLLLASSNIRLIIQNRDDSQILENLNIVKRKKIRLIRGAGVSVKDFYPKKVQNDISLVILPARMLWDKGVEDFVNCAKRCIDNKISVQFVLVGNPDLHNPEFIPEAQLKQWVELGFVEWWGEQDNMLKIYHMADLVCFPSYHEGLPKALLEAASCELPIVSYDVSGCREIVKDNVNGFLVPFKDEQALYDAVLELLGNPSLRRKMGEISRKMVIEEFTQEKIASETIRVWDEISK